MGNALKDRRTPREFAASRQVIEIADKISEFERLSAYVETELAALDADRIPTDWGESRVCGRLAFRFADGREDLPLLEGHAATRVHTVCQRCLEPMELPLEVELHLLLADGEFDDFEVWELDEATIRPVDIVDEALVMSIPMSVLHDDADRCEAATTTAQAVEEKIRPFAALREQMEQSD